MLSHPIELSRLRLVPHLECGSSEVLNFFGGIQTVSGPNFAWGAPNEGTGSSTLSLSRGSAFDFESFWARTQSENGSDTVIAHGFNGATEVTQTINLTGTYQLFSLNFHGITQWTLTNQAHNVLIDDITLNTTPVPAPSSARACPA